MRLTFKDVRGPTQRLETTIEAKEIRKAAPYVGPLIHALRPQPDADPAFTQGLETILKAIFGENRAIEAVSSLSDGFRKDFAELGLPELAGLHALSFIAAQDVAGRGIERHGSMVSRILYYKAPAYRGLRSLLLYLTDGGLITDEDIVDD